MDEALPSSLAGIRVLDATDEYGAYAGRLLAMLGADVIRIERRHSEQHPIAPVVNVGEDTVSLFDEYVSAGKRSVYLDSATDAGRNAFHRLVESVDVLLSGSDGDAPGSMTGSRDNLVHVAVTPFGWDQGPDWSPVDDLLVMGAGGLLHLGGYTDSGPVAAFGGQSRFAAGIFAAVAAIAGLIERQRSGSGLSADVSAQEAVAQALEDSVAEYSLTGTIRGAQGDDAREAGTGIYHCADGYVSMVAGRLGTQRAWVALVEWLAEDEPAAQVLMDPEWSDFSYRQSAEASETFRRIFEEFASGRTKESLYVDAQARQIALSPVNTVDDLLTDRQLVARSFFVPLDHDLLGAGLAVPGPPFRLSQTPPLNLGSPARRGADTRTVLDELGLSLGEVAPGEGAAR